MDYRRRRFRRSGACGRVKISFAIKFELKINRDEDDELTPAIGFHGYESDEDTEEEETDRGNMPSLSKDTS